MKLLGFNFKKINAERSVGNAKDVKISTNIDISDILSPESDILKTKEDVLAVKFTFRIDYNPNFGKVELIGDALLAIEPKLAKEIIKDWKDKKIPEEFRLPLYNLILRKSTLKALQLEEEIGLPLHMPLPVIGSAKKN